MQFVVLGKFNEKFNQMPPEQQRTGMASEWAKSREYYAKGLLRQIWLFEADQAIMSVFEADSRARMDQLLADYPGVIAGFVTAEIREAKPNGGFAPEFAE